MDSETLLVASVRMPFLPGFDEAQGCHPDKADGKQKVKGIHEGHPMPYPVDHAVDAIQSQERLADAQPGKRGTVAPSHPRVRNAFNTKFWRPDKIALYIADGFQYRFGVIQGNTGAKDEQEWKSPETPFPVTVEMAMGIEIHA
jgi:hypothetical protein